MPSLHRESTDSLIITHLSILHKYIQHLPKMWRDVVIAVPKTTETRYRDGDVQVRQSKERLHK